MAWHLQWSIKYAEGNPGIEAVLLAGDTLTLGEYGPTGRTARITAPDGTVRLPWINSNVHEKAENNQDVDIQRVKRDFGFLSFPLPPWNDQLEPHVKQQFAQVATMFKKKYKREGFRRLEGSILVKGNNETATLWQLEDADGVKILIVDITDPRAPGRIPFLSTFQGGMAHGEPL